MTVARGERVVNVDAMRKTLVICRLRRVSRARREGRCRSCRLLGTQDMTLYL